MGIQPARSQHNFFTNFSCFKAVGTHNHYDGLHLACVDGNLALAHLLHVCAGGPEGHSELLRPPCADLSPFWWPFESRVAAPHADHQLTRYRSALVHQSPRRRAQFRCGQHVTARTARAVPPSRTEPAGRITPGPCSAQESGGQLTHSDRQAAPPERTARPARIARRLQRHLDGAVERVRSGVVRMSGR